MAVDRIETSRATDEAADLSMAEAIEQLGGFQGPPEQFLHQLLAVQCRLGTAEAGAVLRVGADGRTEVLAVHPPVERGATAPVWLAQAVEGVANTNAAAATRVVGLHGSADLYGQPARRQLVLVPLRGGAGVRGVAAFVVAGGDPSALAARRERLEMTVGLLSLYEMRLTLQRRQADLQRLRGAMETLAAVNDHDRFAAAAMAMCNEVAARWGCTRVGLGFLAGRYVRLRALSHTEKFSRKMALVQQVEAAMEECLDQDLEVVHPADADQPTISRAAAELSARHGPSAVLSLPLRRGGQPVAVLTAERPPDAPFSADPIESLRLTCDLCAPRLVNLHERARWFGATAAAKLRQAAAAVVGPRHTWVKLGVAAGLAAVLFLVFAQGDYQAEASCVLEATQRQVVPAPFDGYLKSVAVRPGSPVQAGQTVLGELGTTELRLELAAARAERAGYLKQADAALRDGKTVEAQIARAQADGLAAKVRLLEHRIAQARLVAPISGQVVAGDLERRIGAPVQTGDVLFEIAPIESLRAELLVPEDRVADVVAARAAAERAGTPLRGELATASYPDRRIGFVIERINPVAEVVDQRNVFRARVRLARSEPWMRPGMEGLAKVTIDRRRYAWIWTRPLVNWLRMKLWL